MFLDQNQLILMDYIPGSSGRLLMRLLAELDNQKNYQEERLLDKNLNEHRASKEIYFHTLPKRYVDWYWHKMPGYDQNVLFDQIGCFSVAERKRNDFFKDRFWDMKNERIYYGCHSWENSIDYKILHKNITPVSIVPNTERGKQYQTKRAEICYPKYFRQEWIQGIEDFNSKYHKKKFDFCTCLVDKDTEQILDWIKCFLPKYNSQKTDKAVDILNRYYQEVVDNV